MRSLVLFLLLFASVCSFGQELKKGLILRVDSDTPPCCVYIPTSGFTAFEQPQGKQIGKLVRGQPDNNGEVYYAFLEGGDKKTEFGHSNMSMVGYEIMAVKYVDHVDGFVQTVAGFWLDVEELQEKGLRLITWMDYLIEKENVLGWYANDPGLNLRTEPSTDSQIIETLKGDLWEIAPTKERRGLWCKVTVTEYRKHPCSGEDDLKIRTLTGWVKLLSDEQTPNVWNYGKGC